MPLPKFRDGVVFSGQTKFWAVINGLVWKGVVESPTSTPYLASFGWHGGDIHCMWGPSTTPVNCWVTEAYSTKKAALTAQRKIKCKCGKSGRLRFVRGYPGYRPPQNPVAVGVWCKGCWPEKLKAHGGIESKAVPRP